MAQKVVTLANLSTTFDIGMIEADKINIKIDGTLIKNADGTLGMSAASLVIVSPDTDNIIIADANGKAKLTQADVQAVETVWSASEPDSFLTITPAGINGHDVTYGFDWDNAVFKEAVQDAIGAAALAGAGVTYDDVANAISTNLGNIAFGDGLNYDTTANVVTVKPDTSSPSLVEVSTAGVKVTTGISSDTGNLAALGTDNKVFVDPAGIPPLATVDVQDVFGVHLYNAFV